MDKLQQFLTEHKDKLGKRMVIDDNAREYKKVILLDFRINGKFQTFSLNDLIFGTSFISWLERKLIDNGTERVRYNEYEYDCDSQNSDYHKINLVLLDTDESRIQYLEDNLV